MPLDETNYGSYSDYHSAIDQQDTTLTPGIAPVSYTPVSAPAAAPARTGYAGPGYAAPPPRKPQPTVDTPYTYDETRPGFSFRPEDVRTDEGKVYWSDYGKAAWNNVKQTGADLLGAVNYATGQLSSDPHAMQWAKDWRKSLEDSIEATTNSMSPAAKEAYQASLFGNDPNAPKPGDVGWGRYLGINLAAQAPTLLSFILPSTIGAKVALGAAKMAGAGEKALATAARIGSQGTTAGFFGAQNAGAVYNQIHDEIGNASDATMMGSPLYAEARRNGASELEAKEQVTNKVAGLVGAGAAVVGAVAGSGMTSAVTHGALGTAGRGAIARAGIGAAEGAGLMGAQGAANEALTQTAGQQAGTQQGGYDIGKIIAGAVSAGIPGAVFGAGGGLLHRGEIATPKPTEKGIQDTRSEPIAGVPADQREAIEAALPPATADTGGQGTIPGLGQQTEMFGAGQTGAAPPAPPIRGMQPGMPETATQGNLLDPSTRVSQPGPTQGTLPLRPEPPPEQAAPVAQPTATVPQPAQPQPGAVAAGPVTGAPTTPVAGAAPVTPREPAGAAAGTQARPAVDVKNLPSKGMKRAALIDALATAGEDPKKLGKMIPKDLAALFDRRAARGDLGTVDEQPAAQPTPKLAAAKPIEQAAPVESKPAETPPVGELPLPDQPGGALSPQAAVASAEPAAPAEATPTQAQATRVAGYDRNPDDALSGRLEHINEQLANDKTLAPEAAKSLRRTAGLFGRFIENRDLILKGKSPEHAAMVRGIRVDDIVTGTTSDGQKVRGSVDGFGASHVGIKDINGIDHDIPIARIEHVEPVGREATKVTPGVTPEAGVEQKVEEKPTAQAAPKTAEAVAVSKRAAQKARMQATGAEAKPASQEAILKAKATREAAEAEAKKEAAAQKLALIKQRAEEVKAARAEAAHARSAAVRAASGERFAVETERGAKAAEVEEKAPEEARADVAQEVHAAEDTGIATQTYGEGVTPKERAETTTDRKRIQDDLVDAVAVGEKSGPEAHAEYEQGRRQGGRQRREGYDTLAEGLERRLAESKNNAVHLELLRQQQEHEAHTDLTGREKQARTEELDRLLEHFDPERIERLETALKEIRDPVGHAAENTPAPPKSMFTRHVAMVEAGGTHTRNVLRAMHEVEGLGKHLDPSATPEERAAMEHAILDRRGVKPEEIENVHKRLKRVPEKFRDAVEQELARKYGERGRPLSEDEGSPTARPIGISPHRSRYVRAGSDPRMDASYVRMMQQAHDTGNGLSLHDVLHSFTRDSLIRSEMRPFRELAQRLLKLLPDMQVMTPDVARAHGRIDERFHGEFGQRAIYGAFDPDSNTIISNIHQQRYDGTHIETVLHEAVHVAEYRYLNHLKKTDPTHPHVVAIWNIRRELGRLLDEAARNGELDQTEIRRVAKSLQDPHETLAMLTTSPTVQAFAARQKASPEFRATMNRLGFPPRGPNTSVWRYFTDWVRKALGLGTGNSASEHTFLDHILRPVTDIVEHGAQYNERLLPNDPTLRAHAEPLYHASSDYLRDAGRGIADRLTPSTLPDKLRSVVLGASNVDAIVRHNSDILPGLRDYQVARDRIAKANSDAAEKYSGTVRDLLKVWGKLPDQKAVGQLRNDATLAEAHLGSNLAADANKHLDTPEQQASLRELQARYDKLSPAAKDFYDRSNKLYNDLYKDRRDAELKGSLHSVIPDVTEAQEEAFVKAARNQKALKDFMDNPDNSEIAQAFGAKWTENRELAKAIARSHSYGYVKGDYTPQRRYGEYVVKYGKDEQQGVEFFDRKSKAEARRKELVAQYGKDDVWQVTKHNQKFTRDILADHPAVAELETALANKGFTGDQAQHARDTLASILVNHMANSAAQKMRLKRQGVLGAETDQGRVMAHELVNHVNRQGYLLHGGERQAALTKLWSQQHDLERPTEKPGDAIRATQIIQSLEKRQLRPEEMNNAAQRILAHVNGFNYSMSLQSLSHMITGSMEAHTNSIALLGGRHGMFRSSGTIAKNLAQAAPMLGKTPQDLIKAVGHNLSSSDWNVLQMLTNRFSGMKGVNKQHLQALHDMLAQSGLVDHTMISDLRRQMNPEGVFGGKVAGAWERFNDMNAIMAHSVDAMNRYVSAKSAFDLEFAKTKDVGKALEYAEKTARAVMPNYASGNRELITSPKGPLGVLGAPLMQFKRYGLHMYAMMGNLVKESMRAGTSAERWEARKSLALLMGTHAMMAGALGLPTTDAIRYIMGAYDLISGKAAPHNYENDMRGALTSVFGPQVGELIARGLPHALGFDVHRRVSLNNLLEMPELSSFGKSGIGDVLLHLATGATGENLQSLATGATKIMQGDLGGAKALLPRIVRDPMKAISLASQGVTDSRGNTVLPAAKLSPYDIGLQAVGFQPSKVSEVRESRNAILEARQETSAERSHLEQRWLRGDSSDKAAAWQAIVAYNTEHPTARITRQQLLQQQQAEKRSAGTLGLRLPKKSAAALMQAGAFANVQ